MKIGRRGAAVAPVAIVLVVAGAFALRAANTIAGAPLELATAPANATGLCNAARDGDTLSGIGGGGDPFTICSPS